MIDLWNAIGAALPLSLAPYSFAVVREGLRYTESRLPPRKVFLFSVLLLQWILFVVTWLTAVLAMYVVFFACMLVVLNRDPDTYAALADAAVFPFRPEHVLWHVGLVAAPLLLLVSIAWSRPDDARWKVEAKAKFQMTTMFVAFLVAYAAGALAILARPA